MGNTSIENSHSKLKIETNFRPKTYNLIYGHSREVRDLSAIYLTLYEKYAIVSEESHGKNENCLIILILNFKHRYHEFQFDDFCGNIMT